MAYVIITELEKTIILVLLVLSRGNAKKYLSKKSILTKFTPNQKRLVEKFLRKLARSKYVEKKGSTENYRLTEQGTVFGKRLLVTGVNLWKMRTKQTETRPQKRNESQIPEIVVEGSERQNE